MRERPREGGTIGEGERFEREGRLEREGREGERKCGSNGLMSSTEDGRSLTSGGG